MVLKRKIISNKSKLIGEFNAPDRDCGYQGGVVKDFIRNSIDSRLFYFIFRGNWFCLRSLMSIYFFYLTFIKINRKHVKYKFNLNFSIKSPWTLTWPTHFHFRLNTVTGQARTGQGGNREMTETLLVLECNPDLPKEKLRFLFIFMAFWRGKRKLDIYVNFWRTILS